MPRTRKTNIQSALDALFNRKLEALKFETLKQIEAESKKIIADLQQQLIASIQNDISRIATPTISNDFGSGAIGNTPSPLGGLGSVIGSVLRLRANRPSRRTDTQETDRSKQAQSQFRLSRAQQMAELSSALAQGEKNI